MDRTIATGTGYIGQYSPEVQKKYETLAACPDELLLFMHHVPYTYVLHSGKTVIQHIYDSHYDGAEQAARLGVRNGSRFTGKLTMSDTSEVLKRLQYQAGHAIVWRDSVDNYFRRLSGIEGGVWNSATRIEAETMQLSGYTPVEVTPWETASGGQAVVCKAGSACSASFVFNGDRNGHAGFYRIAVQYFDQNNGVSHYELLVDDRVVDSWAADDHLPSDKMNGHTSTRHTTVGVELKPGSVVKIIGHPDGGEAAPLDYVELTQTIMRERHSGRRPGIAQRLTEHPALASTLKDHEETSGSAFFLADAAASTKSRCSRPRRFSRPLIRISMRLCQSASPKRGSG